MIANKNVKYLFYRYNDFLRNSKLTGNKVVLEELQNRDILIQNLIYSIENKKTIN